jgi:peptide methionine sulfoxide reductase MsrB
MQSLAEPQFLFESPAIRLFSVLNKSAGVTTFYDSACGVPVFRAPVNRTMAEFEQDTNEHGWPSFRDGEVIVENVRTLKDTGYVVSSCNTHLGSFLPDTKGSRWCIDLSCISGNPSV